MHGTATGGEPVAPRTVMGPLMSPWRELDEPSVGRGAGKVGFWRSVAEFIFDYNRF